jgi:hypothetical protein
MDSLYIMIFRPLWWRNMIIYFVFFAFLSINRFKSSGNYIYRLP